MFAIDLLGYAAILLLILVSGFLALWCKYESGVTGHLALTAVVVGGAMLLLEGHTENMSPAELLVFLGMSVFMVRHLKRRWYRLSRSWPARRKADKPSTTSKCDKSVDT